MIHVFEVVAPLIIQRYLAFSHQTIITEGSLLKKAQ